MLRSTLFAFSLVVLSANVSAQVALTKTSLLTSSVLKESQLSDSASQLNIQEISQALALNAIESAPTVNQYEDPFNLIYSADLNFKSRPDIELGDLPESAITKVKFKPFKKSMREANPRLLHPVLEKWIQERDPKEVETLVVTFKNDLEIPRLPNPREDLPRDSEVNKKLLQLSERMIEEIKAKRTKLNSNRIKELHGRFGAEIKDQFWLVNSIVVDVALGQVKELLSMNDLVYIEPDTAGEVPPANEVLSGRQLVVSDPYFNLGQTGGYIGLLDTGLRFTHTQFNSPSNIDFRYDCTNGVCDNTPDVTDDCWNHGTSTAAIVSGNNNLGNLYRGVTGITLDSFKVYPASCGFLNVTATVKAFEKAISIFDRVIIAEMQGGGNFNSTISQAADAAFDAGAVIIAANGNNGPSASTVNSPANAHKVLGVGNFDVGSGNQVNSQSRGPASDNRIKPDIQAPTNTRTASNASDTATRTFGGTSGATPYASGVAALMRNWMRGGMSSIDPGQVYSHLILSGQTPYPFNNTSGAGELEMPTGGRGYWGKTYVYNAGNIEIPISVPAGKTKIEGALWWPEGASQSHNDIDLYLISPSGAIYDSSISSASVFERARYSTTALPSGTWKIRIRGYSVPAGPQTVYWSARVR